MLNVDMNVDSAKLRKLIKLDIQKFGSEYMITLAIEECSELIKEICKAMRGNADLNHIAEEAADVLITMEEIGELREIKYAKPTISYRGEFDVISTLAATANYLAKDELKDKDVINTITAAKFIVDKLGLQNCVNKWIVSKINRLENTIL